MKLEECKFCDIELEYMKYGHPEWNEDRAPYKFPVCYDCLKDLKKYLQKCD